MSAIALRPLNGRHLGGLEIRRFAEKFMGVGLGVSIAVHIMLLATYQIVSFLVRHDAPQYVSIPIVLNPVPPPSIDRPIDDPMRRVIMEKPAPPTANIPKPIIGEVPDDAPSIPTQTDLRNNLDRQYDSLMKGLGGDDQVIITQPVPPEETIPPPETFTPYEQPPRLTNPVQPEYPAMARSAGVPGKVWAKFYVDKKGDVREVVILKATPEGLGFEEETIKAIKQWKFTPALQNENPVGVWVGQAINFRLQ